MLYGELTLLQKVEVVREYRMYLDRYSFSANFWQWLLDGEREDGCAVAAAIRDIPSEEADWEIGREAELLTGQVMDQLRLHEAAQNVVQNPIIWGQHFVGKNKAQSGQLRKGELGLWACRRVHIEYRKEAWPADPRHLFPWKKLPIQRTYLYGVHPLIRDEWANSKSVIAAEARVIGYLGRVVANTGFLLRTAG